jgi:DHA1 family multidrug resistance protein-like MFS transporter
VIGVAALGVILWLEDPPRVAEGPPPSPLANLRHVLGDGRTQLGLAGLTVGMAAIGMVMPIFPLYVEDLLGPERDPSFWTGMGFAVVAAATLIASSFLGRLTNRVGLKVVFLVSLAVSAAALALHPVVTELGPMLAVRALLGLGAAGIAPVLYTMISRSAPEKIRGGIAGFASAATILGFFVGPVAGGWLAARTGLDGVFFLGAVALVACGIVATIAAKRLGRDRVIRPLPEVLPR